MIRARARLVIANIPTQALGDLLAYLQGHKIDNVDLKFDYVSEAGPVDKPNGASPMKQTDFVVQMLRGHKDGLTSQEMRPFWDRADYPSQSFHAAIGNSLKKKLIKKRGNKLYAVQEKSK